MSTILFWLAVFVLAIVLFSMVPGLDLLMKPLLKMLFDGLVLLLGGMTSWGIWFLKRVLRAHGTLVSHLLLSAEQIDPAYALDQKSKKA
ncbi:hypothetical protein [Thiomonas sp.]